MSSHFDNLMISFNGILRDGSTDFFLNGFLKKQPL